MVMVGVNLQARSKPHDIKEREGRHHVRAALYELPPRLTGGRSQQLSKHLPGGHEQQQRRHGPRQREEAKRYLEGADNAHQATPRHRGPRDTECGEVVEPCGLRQKRAISTVADECPSGGNAQ
jgi:hypothetical protein